jgi:phosphatidate cytidylyltransferase
MLKQRVLTAIPLALVVLGTIVYLDTQYASYLFGLILFVSMIELANLVAIQSKIMQWSLAALMLLGFFLLLPQMGIRALFYQSYLGLLLWLVILLSMMQYRFSGQWSQTRRLSIGLLSALLLWICVNGLLFIHAHFTNGGWLLMYLLSLVWVADIGAYFSGKRFGRHKLAPGISPGKTWEGVIGGLLLNVFWISLVYALSEGWGLHYLWFLILGLLTSALSVVGDLYESILKREAGLKDSGKILPGHGGILDRIDSVIAATPVYLAGLYMLGAI